jgi:hypothetical protein
MFRDVAPCALNCMPIICGRLLAIPVALVGALAVFAAIAVLLFLLRSARAQRLHDPTFRATFGVFFECYSETRPFYEHAVSISRVPAFIPLRHGDCASRRCCCADAPSRW